MGVYGKTFAQFNTHQAIDHQTFVFPNGVTVSGGNQTMNCNYQVGNVDVFVRGIKMAESEFTADDGTSVSIPVATLSMTAGDEITIIGRKYPTADIMNSGAVNISGGQVNNTTMNNSTLTNASITTGTIGTSVTGFGLITHSEMWRVTSNWTGDDSGTGVPSIIENWELADTYNYSSHGSSVWSWDETNDAFTCSQTGIWRIDFRLTQADNGGSTSGDNYDPSIRTCTDWNGSSGTWYVVATGFSGDYGIAHSHSDVNVMYLWNLKNTSNHALQFIESYNNSVHNSHDFMGSTNQQTSGVIFTRIGDMV